MYLTKLFPMLPALWSLLLSAILSPIYASFVLCLLVLILLVLMLLILLEDFPSLVFEFALLAVFRLSQLAGEFKLAPTVKQFFVYIERIFGRGERREGERRE